MTQQHDLKTDCRHFRWDRPCAPHKATGVICPGCPEYDRVESRVAIVKLAAVGDVLRTTSLLPAVKARYRGAWITWVTSPAAIDLFVEACVGREASDLLSFGASGLEEYHLVRDEGCLKRSQHR